MMNWKEFGRKSGVAESRYYPDICVEGLRKAMKISVKIAGVPAKVTSTS
jgi:hypothetical protein